MLLLSQALQHALRSEGPSIVLIKRDLPAVELPDGPTPRRIDGTAAIDNTVELMAVEVAGNYVQIISLRSCSQLAAFESRVNEIRALALNTTAHMLAIGTADGKIVLRDASTGQVHRVITINDQPLTAIAFNRDGRLLGAGDFSGRVAIYQTATGQKLWDTAAGDTVSAIAVDNLGSPVVVGRTDGWLRAHHRLQAPIEMQVREPDSAAPVTCLTFQKSRSGKLLAGRADGSICQSDSAYTKISNYLNISHGPVRALGSRSDGQIIALADNQLHFRLPESTDRDHFASFSALIGFSWGQLKDWSCELIRLISNFPEVQQLTRDEIAAERSNMLAELDGIDDVTLERIRPVVVDSAMSIFDSHSLDLALRKVLNANPLPVRLRNVFIFIGQAAIAIKIAVNFLHLGSIQAVSTAIVTFLAMTWVLYSLFSGGPVSRIAGYLTVFINIFIVIEGPGAKFNIPAEMHQMARHWLQGSHIATPYPLWLGMLYPIPILLLIIIGNRIICYLEVPGSLARRRNSLSAALLHALLDVAYQAHIMANNRRLAESRAARTNLHHLESGHQ